MGTVVYTAGSTDCVVFSMKEPSSDRRWVCCGFEPGESWGEIGTSTASGASVEWFGRTFLGAGRDVEGGCEDGYRRMSDCAASSEPGSGGVIFLPYLQGERTPVWDPDERGVFVGLTHRTSIGSLARAVYEGTSFALRHIIESLESVSPVPVKEIVAVGGCTKNDLWNRIKADVLQMPLHVLEFQETGTLGAALLAGIGAGVFASYREASEAARGVNRSKRVDPDPGKKGLYDEFFSLYRKIHPKVKSISHSLTRLDAKKGLPPR